MPPNGRKQQPEKRPSFEEAFAQLKEAVTALEAGGLTLEQSTQLYDKGMHLARVCNELLSAAELKITRLQRTFGDQMAMLDVTPDEPEPDEEEVSLSPNS